MNGRPTEPGLCQCTFFVRLEGSKLTWADFGQSEVAGNYRFKEFFGPLVAANTAAPLAEEVKKLRERPAIRRITIDPAGYVVLEFDTFDDRADFCYWIPKGQVYGDTRHNTGGPPYCVSWKLEDFKMPFTLQMTDQSRAEKAAIEEANRKQ